MPKVMVGGVRLHYEERGSGTPIVFISGLRCFMKKRGIP